MILWTWEAGAGSGVAGEQDTARRHAEARLRSGQASEAFLQQVTLATGAAALDNCYRPVAGSRVRGRLGAGLRAVWKRTAELP